MGTEVLRPHDCLVDRLRFSPPAFHRRRSSALAGNGFVIPNPNNNNNYYYHHRKTANDYRTTEQQQQQPDHHRKRKPIIKQAGNNLSRKRSSSAEDLLQTRINKTAADLNNTEFEPAGRRITILRRGQSLESFEKNITTQNASSTCSITTTDVYAGSGFYVSPSPNSLPLPSFFSNNNKKIESDNCATRDLRRLLGLE